MGDAHVEQRTTFDTYYANTPFIREMIVLYITAHAVASLTVSRLCWRWSREVHGTLGAGLRILAAGYLMHYAGYDTARSVAVAACWTGRQWNFLLGLSNAAAQPSALLVAVGFILPLIGRRTEDAIRYWRLAPLARVVGPVPGTSLGPLPAPWWRPSLRLRLTQRQTYISDRIVACRSRFCTQIRKQAYEAALAHRHGEDDAAAIAEAAVIVNAVKTCGLPESGAALAQQLAPTDDFPFTSDLVRISRALRSPIVKGVRMTRANVFGHD
ncbi:DUF6545 domain-containing protein [Streptomyces avermitilis]|uniref:DUF6545 domain-containing protein n=1 Tax=Streptomyces avermitilis TaxID=33903 RepID=UPI0033E01288